MIIITNTEKQRIYDSHNNELKKKGLRLLDLKILQFHEKRQNENHDHTENDNQIKIVIIIRLK